ncbi:mitochondrial carrier [Linderina pennispora]|uniref:Mitochondrial carrier n=1 Tax=Linderina pennispora TaxID=61395 RepID=A0A1Y1VY17_9FUNG|nr:mitochondrial carrier [Linderina pennispora]ORX65915.1 mitochondrial carrier [Linderina pennispora]
MEAEFPTVSEIAKHDERPRISGFEDLAFGSLAGMAGKFVEYPFDTVKVRLQTSESQVFSGTLDCLKQTWQNEGFRGFYRGLASPLLGAMAENAVAFYAYNRIQSIIRTATNNTGSELTLPQLFLSGGLSGTICAFVISPVELVKCKLQVENVQAYGGAASTANVKFTGPISVVKHLLKTQGIAGIYKGITPTVARETVGVGCWFGAYEVVVRQLMRSQNKAQKSDLGPGSIILAGGCAGVAYNISSYPIDVVKSFIQTADVRATAGAPERPGIASTIRTVYGRGGIRAFYRGLGITLVRAFPANAAMFMTYEYLSRLSIELRQK